MPKRVFVLSAAVLAIPALAILASAVFWLAIGAPQRPSRGLTVAGRNMEPTLAPGDRVVSNAAVAPRAGSIVAFKDPNGQLFGLISRVVAVGGQTVDLRDCRLFVDGKAVDEPYTHGLNTEPGSLSLPVTLPADSFWVMGDSRRNSADSRYFGPIPRSSVMGVVTVRYWPLSRFQRF